MTPFIIERAELTRGLYVAVFVPYAAFEFSRERTETLERLGDELRDLLEAAADPDEAAAALAEAGR